MTPVVIIARKEFQRCVRNRWIVATTLLMLALSMSLALLGSAPMGTVATGRLSITIVSLSSLTIFLVPLIALMLSFDTVVGDTENGTLFLLLTYPVQRWQIIAGKFVGHTAVLSLATIIGYGTAGLAVGLMAEGTGIDAWTAFATMSGSSVLLGMAFLAIGCLISVLVKERGTAAGLAVAMWLIFVLLFDMGLLGLLVADKGATLKAGTVTALMMLNPADVYRMLNLTGSSEIAALSGMATVGKAGQVSQQLLAAILVAWSVIPLTLAMLVFRRREL